MFIVRLVGLKNSILTQFTPIVKLLSRFISSLSTKETLSPYSNGNSYENNNMLHIHVSSDPSLTYFHGMRTLFAGNRIPLKRNGHIQSTSPLHIRPNISTSTFIGDWMYLWLHWCKTIKIRSIIISDIKRNGNGWRIILKAPQKYALLTWNKWI